jgi:hypothetical protein
MPAPDLKRLAVLLDIAVTSDHEGEATNAWRRARSMMRQAGLHSADLIEAMLERDRALDTLAKYSARLDQLEGENQRLRNLNGAQPASGTLGAQIWHDAGIPRTATNRHAEWLLNLEMQGRLHLTSKEIDFLGSCSRRSRLSQAQQEWLQDILRTAIARTGQTPPP